MIGRAKSHSAVLALKISSQARTSTLIEGLEAVNPGGPMSKLSMRRVTPRLKARVAARGSLNSVLIGGLRRGGFVSR